MHNNENQLEQAKVIVEIFRSHFDKIISDSDILNQKVSELINLSSLTITIIGSSFVLTQASGFSDCQKLLIIIMFLLYIVIVVLSLGIKKPEEYVSSPLDATNNVYSDKKALKGIELQDVLAVQYIEYINKNLEKLKSIGKKINCLYHLFYIKIFLFFVFIFCTFF